VKICLLRDKEGRGSHGMGDRRAFDASNFWLPFPDITFFSTVLHKFVTNP